MSDLLDMMTAPDPVAPLSPPREWFEEAPEWLDPSWELGVVQIGPEGRVAALVAPYGECILDGTRECWQPPQSPTNYEYAHVGAVVTAEGDTVRVANIGGGVGHFDPTRATAMSPAVDHYANTASRVMYGRYHDRPDLGGIVFFGSMWPTTTPPDVMAARASALSGDWRWVESLGAYDMAGSQMVNTPGFRPNRKRAWQPHLAAMQFAVVACMTPGGDGHEALRGAWNVTEEEPMETHPMADLHDRLYRLEAALAALLDDGVEDSEFFEEEPEDYIPGLPYLSAMIAAGHPIKGAKGAEKLRQYWLHGEGAAKIRWGTPGDWTRCFKHLSKYLGPRAKGYCQLMHGRATGEWAGRNQKHIPNPAIKALARAKQMQASMQAVTAAGGHVRDGDKDGRIYDNTPRERPYVPLPQAPKAPAQPRGQAPAAKDAPAAPTNPFDGQSDPDLRKRLDVLKQDRDRAGMNGDRDAAARHDAESKSIREELGRRDKERSSASYDKARQAERAKADQRKADQAATRESGDGAAPGSGRQVLDAVDQVMADNDKDDQGGQAATGYDKERHRYERMRQDIATKLEANPDTSTDDLWKSLQRRYSSPGLGDDSYKDISFQQRFIEDRMGWKPMLPGQEDIEKVGTGKLTDAMRSLGITIPTGMESPRGGYYGWAEWIQANVPEDKQAELWAALRA